MTDYLRFKKSAIEKIFEKGRNVVLVSFSKSGPSYDPVLTPVETPTKAVQSNFDSNEIDGTSVLASDLKLLFGADVEPAIGMQIIDGLKTYEIKNVNQIKPGDTLILSEVQARI